MPPLQRGLGFLRVTWCTHHISTLIPPVPSLLQGVWFLQGTLDWCSPIPTFTHPCLQVARGWGVSGGVINICTLTSPATVSLWQRFCFVCIHTSPHSYPDPCRASFSAVLVSQCDYEVCTPTPTRVSVKAEGDYVSLAVTSEAGSRSSPLPLRRHLDVNEGTAGLWGMHPNTHRHLHTRLRAVFASSNMTTVLAAPGYGPPPPPLPQPPSPPAPLEPGFWFLQVIMMYAPCPHPCLCCRRSPNSRDNVTVTWIVAMSKGSWSISREQTVSCIVV